MRSDTNNPADRGMPKPTLPFFVDVAAGLAASSIACLILMLAVLLGVPVGTATWIGVFLVLWASIFVLLRFKRAGIVIGFAIGIIGGRFIIGWWFGF